MFPWAFYLAHRVELYAFPEAQASEVLSVFHSRVLYLAWFHPEVPWASVPAVHDRQCCACHETYTSSSSKARHRFIEYMSDMPAWFDMETSLKIEDWSFVLHDWSWLDGVRWMLAWVTRGGDAEVFVVRWTGSVESVLLTLTTSTVRKLGDDSCPNFMMLMYSNGNELWFVSFGGR